MSGMFTAGEVKVRPGAYSNIQKVGENRITGALNGVTAVVFKADFGPLNQPVELSAAEGYEKLFGTAHTTDAISQAFQGGAKKVIACRIGSGGDRNKVRLADDSAQEAVEIIAKYPGTREFTVSIRKQLADDTKKECIIYDGTREFEKYVFDTNSNEAAALVEAMSNSGSFHAVKLMDTDVAEVTQAELTDGTDPTVNMESYSDGFAALEAFEWNVICVDTTEAAVHALLTAYLDRIYDAGQLCMGVVAEKEDVSFEQRMKNAAAFNNAKMHYVVNSAIKTNSGNIDGYQTAARVAGMIAACPSSRSLTHVVMDGALELNEKLTPTQIAKAETMGCIVLTMNSGRQIWIDSGINTLVTLSADQDEGWKKIRRTKTRYELVTRAVAQADGLIGQVDNDENGRATIVSQVQGVGMAMVEEGKLVACNVTESSQAAEGDTAYFDIDAIDKDSAEHIYLTFKFRFGTQE